MTGTMMTDRLYTGQRQMSGLGIYHYGARFYSPYINRFLSADTVVPGYTNPQNLNRYSYVLNNPVKLTDPSGHRATECDLVEGCGSASQAQKDQDAQTLAKLRSQSYDRKCANGNKAYCADQSNAHFKSISGSAGIGPWFLTMSIDWVTTDHEVGVFFSYGTGPGLRDPYTRDFRDLNSFDSTIMTPQLGVTAWTGRLYGKALDTSVDAYSGPALQGGGSAGPFGFETFSSVDKKTGMMNTNDTDTNVVGEAYGLGLGTQPGEAHLNYSNAVNLKPLSFLATLSCTLMGSCN